MGNRWIYRNNGDDLVVMRCRNLSRVTVIIQRECVQSMEKKQNIFQKRKAIAKYKVTISGDIVGKSYKIGYMDERYIEDIIN
ncbi:MAG TPA: PH domain-containing protein [Clostridium sp.]|uniref:PH domain-containing protein n=1 Tax=Clostridium sp. TaxID=1506 RepID=UPI002F950ABF